MGTIAAELCRAVELALHGDWQAAHQIAQRHDDDAEAAWLHAVVHRIEGDLSNARYWYGRCGRTLREQLKTQDELREIAAALGGREGG